MTSTAKPTALCSRCRIGYAVSGVGSKQPVFPRARLTQFRQIGASRPAKGQRHGVFDLSAIGFSMNVVDLLRPSCWGVLALANLSLFIGRNPVDNVGTGRGRMRQIHVPPELQTGCPFFVHLSRLLGRRGRCGYSGRPPHLWSCLMEHKFPPPSRIPVHNAASGHSTALAELKAQLASMSPEERKKALAVMAQVVRAHMKVEDH